MEHKRKLLIPIQFKKGPDFKNPWTLLMLAALIVLIVALAWSPVKAWLNHPVVFVDDAGAFLFARQIPGTNAILALGFEEGGRVRWDRYTLQDQKTKSVEEVLKEVGELKDASESLDSLKTEAGELQEKVEDLGKEIREGSG